MSLASRESLVSSWPSRGQSTSGCGSRDSAGSCPRCSSVGGTPSGCVNCGSAPGETVSFGLGLDPRCSLALVLRRLPQRRDADTSGVTPIQLPRPNQPALVVLGIDVLMACLSTCPALCHARASALLVRLLASPDAVRSAFRIRRVLFLAGDEATRFGVIASTIARCINPLEASFLAAFEVFALPNMVKVTPLLPAAVQQRGISGLSISPRPSLFRVG